MLNNQNKALFIILTSQSKVLCIKIKQSSENSFFRDNCKAQYLQ